MDVPVCDVGILLVHGIGQPRPGQTLHDFGEPLHRWLVRWFEGAQRRWTRSAAPADIERWIERVRAPASSPETPLLDSLRAALLARAIGEREQNADATALADAHPAAIVAGRAELGPSVLERRAESPPYAVVDIAWLRAGGGARRASWLLAEARWAETFAAPRFSDLARWSVETLLWTVASHFLAQIRRARHPWAFLAGCGYFLLSLLLTPIVLILLGALLILAIPPVPAVRAWVVRIQQRLASSAGDSYAFLSSPLRAAAIVTQVRRDLAWLSERARAVVVLAHSQGAAVAHLAVSEPAPSNLRGLVTFGSGLRKLEELRPLLKPDSPWQSPSRTTLLGLVAAVAAGLAVLTGLGGGFLVASGALWGVLALWAGFQLMGHNAAAREEATRAAKSLRERGIAWTDLFASADPVPNGPLLEPEAAEPLLTSRAVHNRASLFRDHTTYWKNEDEFVAALVRAVGEVTPGGLGESLAPERSAFEAGARRRRVRVGALAVVRALAGVALAIVALAGWPLWARLASWIGAEAAARLGRFGAGLLGAKPAGAPALRVPDLSTDDVALLRVLAVVLAAWIAAALAWMVWDAHDTRAFFGRARHRWILSRFLTVLFASALVPLGLAAVLPRLDPALAGRLVHVPAALMVLGVVAGGLVLRGRLKRAAEPAARPR